MAAANGVLLARPKHAGPTCPFNHRVAGKTAAVRFEERTILRPDRKATACLAAWLQRRPGPTARIARQGWASKATAFATGSVSL